MTDKEWIYRIAMSRLRGMKLSLAKQITGTGISPEDIFHLKESELLSRCNMCGKIFQDSNRKKAQDEALAEWDFVRKQNIRLLFFTEEDYPARLSDCPDAPVLLYYRGTADLNAKRIISIVGTRHATSYGKSFCEKFLYELAETIPDLLVVSGLAYGIDICAHRYALENSLQTIGVLAHGMQTLYPAAHSHTASQMLRQGGLLTEYTSEDAITKGNFIARNRIVAGISDATIVVESAEKGGALITANIAGSYHRDVFALPGRVNDLYSTGCNDLITTNQAALITSAGNFLKQMCWETNANKKLPKQISLFDDDLNEDELLLLNLLTAKGEMQVNELALLTNLPASQLLSLLTELEFKNKVRPFPGGQYRIR